ncbi:MAG: UDP-glucose/GDP-mannose dehydrogenase family protein [Chitinophagales bacterium]|nr:UDP-glucose/GDP-mannose dehydrogenase family protein [Chitinophagales bacterium]
MKIAVVGTGYVGLVTGTGLADTGNTVTCIDIDEKKVEDLKNGIIPIFEPGLDVLVDRNVKDERLTFTTELEGPIKEAQIIFFALPTPPGADGSADLSFVLNVAEQIAPMFDDYKVIVDKSTVPVGTADKVREIIARNTDQEFDVVSNPEFLREGAAVDDFMKPERVVIGTSSDKAKELMNRLYKPFVRQGNPIIFMDERSAELTKYAANAFLATKISFMNEIANLCELVDADVDNVRRGVGTDSRIGKRFLFAGVGYGGSCFPKDVQALAKTADDYQYDFQILDSVMEVNTLQRKHFYDKICARFPHGLKGKKIAVWGLSFKPNTDDIREAPALYLIENFLLADAEVRAYDPEAMSNVKKIFSDQISYADEPYDCIKDADMIVLVTEWSVFRTPNFDKINSLMANPVIFDGRNVYDLDTIEETGIEYHSIGRKSVNYNGK